MFCTARNFLKKVAFFMLFDIKICFYTQIHGKTSLPPVLSAETL